MALETGSYINDLVITNPTFGDPKSQGDDHLRLMKTCLQNSLAGFTGAIIVTGTDGGAVNAYTLTPANALPAYGTKMTAVFAPTVTNTGACTLNISGLGVKNLRSVSGDALVAGDLVLGCIYAAFYTGTEFRLLSVTKNYADQLAFSAALPVQSLGLVISDGTTSSFSTTLTGFALNEATGASIASAATINLDTATGNRVHITGTTPITAVTLTRGPRTVIFDGILTLTHHATTNNLPGAANITTAAGDRAIYESDGATVYCVSYIKASGAAVVAGVGGSWIHLSSVTASGAATADLDATIDSTYDVYMITGTGITATTAGGQNLLCHRQISGTYALWGSVLRLDDVISPTWVRDATGIITKAVSDAASQTVSFSCLLYDPSTAATPNAATFIGGGRSGYAVSSFVAINSMFSDSTAGSITGMRFLMASGNINGTFRLYGLSKT